MSFRMLSDTFHIRPHIEPNLLFYLLLLVQPNNHYENSLHCNAQKPHQQVFLSYQKGKGNFPYANEKRLCKTRRSLMLIFLININISFAKIININIANSSRCFEKNLSQPVNFSQAIIVISYLCISIIWHKTPTVSFLNLT